MGSYLENPSESTGQQPTGEESPLHKQDREAVDAYIRTFNSVPYPEEMMSRWAARWGIEYERKRTRWREISKDGLPGECEHGKWIEFLMRHHEDGFPRIKLLLWFKDTPVTHNSVKQIFSYWREIELPS